MGSKDSPIRAARKEEACLKDMPLKDMPLMEESITAILSAVQAILVILCREEKGLEENVDASPGHKLRCKLCGNERWDHEPMHVCPILKSVGLL